MSRNLSINTPELERAADAYTDALWIIREDNDAAQAELQCEARRLAAITLSDPAALIALEENGDFMLGEFKVSIPSWSEPSKKISVSFTRYLLTSFAMQLRMRPATSDEQAVIDAFAERPDMLKMARKSLLGEA